MMHHSLACTRARHLAASLQEGDLIFIACGAELFRRVAAATGCWANHVGLAFKNASGHWMVHESAIPLARRTPLALYLARGGRRQVVVARPRQALTPDQVSALRAASLERLGRYYDFGFNFDGRGQFCSKYVQECYLEATGQPLGQLQTFADLLAAQPHHPLGPWKLWFLGRIPWHRRTVSPASLLDSPKLQPVVELAACG